MGKIQFLVIHSTGTPAGLRITSGDICRMHLVEHQWEQVAFTDMVHTNGQLENLIPYNAGMDIYPWDMLEAKKAVSRHIAYVGGLDAATGQPACTLTPAQSKTLEAYVKAAIARNPEVKVAGYNQFSGAGSPSFDVPEWLVSIGVHKKNSYSVPVSKASAPEKTDAGKKEKKGRK